MIISHQIVCVHPSLVAPLEHLNYSRNVGSLSLFYKYYFDRCSSELDAMVPLGPSLGRPTRYSNRLHDFSATIPGCYNNVYANSFFPRTPRLWNYLSVECFHVTYNLDGFKSRVNRHVSFLGFFLNSSSL